MTARVEATLRRPGHGADGVSLIELVVTLAILGVSLVLVTGYRPPWSGALSIDGTAGRIAEELRLARSEAIVGNRPVAFNVDLVGHRYSIGAGASRRLPGDFSIELLTIAGERQGAR